MVNWRPDADVLQRRCASCHAADKGNKAGAKFRTDDELLANLTEPRRSMILLAPLARSGGGWGICKAAAGPGDPASAAAAVFASADDPDYRKLLASIEDARGQLQKITRFDMPNFRPNAPYVREMKRYGILPASAGTDGQKIDVYAADQNYWKSFWYRPDDTK